MERTLPKGVIALQSCKGYNKFRTS